MELLETMDAIRKTFQVRRPKKAWEKIANDWHNKVSRAYVLGELNDTEREILHSMITRYCKIRQGCLKVPQLI